MAYTIGLAGTLLNNSNLGCLALTYSSVRVLENIASDLSLNFNYIVYEQGYERGQSEHARDVMCQKLGIDPSKVDVRWSGTFVGKKAMVKRVFENIAAIKSVSRCDLIMDMTGGDSFSDIYGYDRIIGDSFAKIVALRKHVPLLLGPQTYGPYYLKKSKDIACRILKNASLVIARDSLSAQCVKEVSGREVPTTTDLAFLLPYSPAKEVMPDSKVLRIGLNASGLLSSHSFENTGRPLELECNYDEMIFELCSLLCKRGVEVHLISHVGADYPLCSLIHDSFPDTILHDCFDNPVDVKGLISSMDCFIGSRMHATIGALSSGVATIPLAYSRKFEGLFGSLGYGHTIDLTTTTTEGVLVQVESLIGDLSSLHTDVEIARCKADELGRHTKQIITNYIKTELMW